MERRSQQEGRWENSVIGQKSQKMQHDEVISLGGRWAGAQHGDVISCREGARWQVHRQYGEVINERAGAQLLAKRERLFGKSSIFSPELKIQAPLASLHLDLTYLTAKR